MKVLDRNTAPAVFVTATFSRDELVSGGLRRLPASEMHAKMMGSTTTLCGRSTLSWFKFWDISFASVQGERCTRCTTAFQRRLVAGEAG
jgi:hypothetical protein